MKIWIKLVQNRIEIWGDNNIGPEGCKYLNESFIAWNVLTQNHLYVGNDNNIGAEGC